MKPLLVFQSDFTYAEGAVGAMYGVVKTVDPSIEIMEITHNIPKFDIWSASFRLYQVIPFWPDNTIFVSVVDPTVGSDRKACVALLKNGQMIVTPDNKTLSHVDKWIGIEKFVEIDPKFKFKSAYRTSVFHGRDIFGYVGALLASGQETLESIGKEYKDIQKFELTEPYFANDRIMGTIENVDPNFGNVWSNIPDSMAKEIGLTKGDHITVCIYHDKKLRLKQHIRYGANYASVDLYQPILYVNELEKLSLALNQGHFAHEYNVGQGQSW